MKNLSVPYAAAIYGEEEINAVLEVLRNPKKIVVGPAVREFEKRIAALFGKTHGVMVNSGSSANLIALEMSQLPAGAEVITPILTFSTTVSPLIQKGLVPVFVDVIPGNYQIDVRRIEPLITEKTKALMIPSLLGNIPDMHALRELADKYHLIFIEDSCDTLGARFDGKPTGVYSDISTTSFYASHIITAAGGGGMVSFHDAALAERALVMSNWGRQSTLFGSYEKSEDIAKRFAGTLDGEVYDAKFIFTEIGYNFQPTEMQGVFGLKQLERLPEFAEIRRKNFAALRDFFADFTEFFILPQEDSRTATSWLAFPLTLQSGTPFSRNDIQKYLEERDIQTRPIFTGNILKQPAFSGLSEKRVDGGGYPVTEHIMKNGFVVGCHHGLTDEHVLYMKEVFTAFLSQYGTNRRTK